MQTSTFVLEMISKPSGHSKMLPTEAAFGVCMQFFNVPRTALKFLERDTTNFRSLLPQAEWLRKLGLTSVRLPTEYSERVTTAYSGLGNLFLAKHTYAIMKLPREQLSHHGDFFFV